MSEFFNCFACKKVSPFVGSTEGKCPGCGSSNGEVISKQRVQEGMKAGAFFSIDPSTGKHSYRSTTLFPRYSQMSVVAALARTRDGAR